MRANTKKRKKATVMLKAIAGAIQIHVSAPILA